MILLSDNFMFFKLPSGESVPFSAEMISVELSDGAGHPFDQDFVHHAAASVFHYFKNDLGRKTVSVAEFASAFESVLNGLGLKLDSGRVAQITDDAANKDLQLLAFHADACELAFFPRLRAAAHSQFQMTPRLVRSSYIWRSDFRRAKRSLTAFTPPAPQSKPRRRTSCPLLTG